MLFNSVNFLIFFIIVVSLYFIIPYRLRWILLLLSSYYFYMAWNPKYIILIILSTIIDYLVSLRMGKERKKSKRKKYLYISLLSNLGILFLFKYFNFFNESFKYLFHNWNMEYNISAFKLLLPMGISFYTFQTLSYTIDVYNGKIKPEKHLGIFALYVSFFPQLVAGPIERSDRLLPQFYEKHDFEYNRVTNGLKRMAWGLFKKVVIADRIAIIVNTVYNNPQNYEGLALMIATGCFAIQIYCDFSGYSDMAIGSASVIGFDLMENFKRPYFAKSIGEFWSRWHISLSTWFRDYVYIPLGGNRVKLSRNLFNLMITFLVSGLWHGANWTFIIWGGIHGLYLIFGKLIKKSREKLFLKLKLKEIPIINMLITFVLVCFAWIFFRANNMSDANYIITHLFSGLNKIQNLHELKSTVINLGLDQWQLVILFCSIIIMFFVHILEEKKSVINRIMKLPVIFRWILYYSLVMIIIFFAITNNKEFIYFQF